MKAVWFMTLLTAAGSVGGAPLGSTEVLVTGGAGYIGSHVVWELIEHGYTPVVVDSLKNSFSESLARVKNATGVEVVFYRVDLLDREALAEVFDRHNIRSVIHLAGLKAVEESEQVPLSYYRNNVVGSLNLLELMKEKGVGELVFSSSATVYGQPKANPIGEDSVLKPTNAYGRTKLVVENMIRDYAHSDSNFKAISLRYFNPVGAHPSGLIGEHPQGTPNNLLPYVGKVAQGQLPVVHVFGSDYETIDGTGVRDYIHVVDLARGHVAALQKIAMIDGPREYNLGTGQGHSVLQIVKAMEQVSGRKIPIQMTGRRAGDVAMTLADPSLARAELGWESTLDLDTMCRDSWNWVENNPNGYVR